MLYVKAKDSTTWEQVAYKLNRKQAYHLGARYLMRGYRISISIRMEKTK